MDACDKDVQLPPAHVLDYKALLSAARAESIVNVSAFLRTHLPSHWRDLYVSTVARPTNFVRFDCGNFEYFCDLYSELEVTGEVAYDQTIQNRVIAVLGTSTKVGRPRGARMRFWFWTAEEFVAANRDRGHFHRTLHWWRTRRKCFLARPPAQPRLVIARESLSSDGNLLL
jgi:hypothetical protein